MENPSFMYTRRLISKVVGGAISDKSVVVKRGQNFLHWKAKIALLLRICVLLHEGKGRGKLPGMCQEEHHTFSKVGKPWLREVSAVCQREEGWKGKASTGRGWKTALHDLGKEREPCLESRKWTLKNLGVNCMIRFDAFPWCFLQCGVSI